MLGHYYFGQFSVLVSGSICEKKLVADDFSGLKIKQRLTTTDNVQLNFKSISSIPNSYYLQNTIRTHNYDLQLIRSFPLRFCIERNHT